MPLPMARPWKHPDSGIYYVRKAVPAQLRPLVVMNGAILSDKFAR